MAEPSALPDCSGPRGRGLAPPGTELHTPPTFLIIPTEAPGGSCCSHPHFTDQVTEAQRAPVRKWPSRGCTDIYSASGHSPRQACCILIPEPPSPPPHSTEETAVTHVSGSGSRKARARAEAWVGLRLCLHSLGVHARLLVCKWG